MSKAKYLVLEVNGQLEPCVEIEGIIYLLNEQKTKVKYEDNEIKGLKLKLKKSYEKTPAFSESFSGDFEEIVEESRNEKIKETIFLKFFPEKGCAALHDEELESREAELSIEYTKNDDGFDLYDYSIEWKDNILNEILVNYSDYISLELNDKIYVLEDVDLEKFGVRVIRNKYDEEILGEATNEARFVKIVDNKLFDIESNKEVNVLLNNISLTSYLSNTANLASTIGQFLIAREQYKNS